MSAHASILGSDDPGDPVGSIGDITGEATSTPYLVDAVLNWTHSVDLTGIVVDSVQLDVAVIGFFYGTDHEKFYVGSPLTEIVNAFPAAAVTDRLQTFSFALPTSVLVSGSLPVQIFVQSDEGWGGVDYAELIVQAAPIDTTTVPEPATMTLAGLGVGLVASCGVAPSPPFPDAAASPKESESSRGEIFRRQRGELRGRQ